MNVKTLALVCAMVVFSGIAANAFSFGPRIGRESNKELRIERLAKELGLTDVQKEKYLLGAKQIEKDAKETRLKNKTLFGDIEKELLKETPDISIIKNILQEINNNNSQMQLKRIEQLIQLRKELSPEQKTKLEAMIKQGKEMLKNRIEKWKK